MIDSHVHFYDPERPGGIVWPPEQSPLFGRALDEELLAFARPLTIEGVVLIETSPRAVDDDWLFARAAVDPLVLGVVANLQPDEAGFEERLELQSQRAEFKGIRLRPIANHDLRSAELRRRLRLVGQRGRTLELGATSLRKLHDYADLAAELSELTCILDHFGHPVIDGKPPTGEWREAIAGFATLPNTACKLTALQSFARTKPAPAQSAFYAPLLEFLFEVFGEDRLLYGSNWPPLSLRGNYATNVRLYQDHLGDNRIRSEKFFRRNARALYRLGEKSGSS